MPKIIDRESKRIEIAQKAIAIFRKQGYSRTSFRDLARRLNMSKSGLYHYFANKDELFVYCGQVLVRQFSAVLTVEGATSVQRCIAFARQLAFEFDAELYLLLDYMRDREMIQEPSSPIEATLELYLQAISRFTGEKRAASVLKHILGELLLRTFVPVEEDDWTALEADLNVLLSSLPNE